MQKAEAAGVRFVYETTVTAEMIEEADPYAVLLAVGAKELVPGIKGVEQDFVTTVEPVLTGRVTPANQHVAVIGSGMTGLETAEFLCEKGNSVTVVEMADSIAPGTIGINVTEIKHILRERGVRFLPGNKLVEIGDHSIVLEDVHSDQRREQSVDAVVLSLGLRGDHTLWDALATRKRVYEIGNCGGPGRIAEAIRNAFDTAREL